MQGRRSTHAIDLHPPCRGTTFQLLAGGFTKVGRPGHSAFGPGRRPTASAGDWVPSLAVEWVWESIPMPKVAPDRTVPAEQGNLSARIPVVRGVTMTEMAP
jgi:hypothetical protein